MIKKRVKQHFCPFFFGYSKNYFEAGLKIDSDEYKLVLEKFNTVGVPLSCFELHPLKKGYVHLTTSREVDNIFLLSLIPQHFDLTLFISS